MNTAHLEQPQIKVSAHLEAKRGIYQMIFNWTNSDKSRGRKSVSTGLPEKGNKKRAGEMLKQAKASLEDELNSAIILCDPSKDNDDPLFVDFLADYLNYKWLQTQGKVLNKKKLSINTYSGYEQTHIFPVAPYFRELGIKLSEVTRKVIEDFYNLQIQREYHEGKSVKANTIKHYHAYIHGAFNWALDTGKLTINPVARMRFNVEKYIAKTLTVDQAMKLLNGVKGLKLEVPVLVALAYGCRRGETLGLIWPLIDFVHHKYLIGHTVTQCRVNGELIIVRQDKAKTVSSRRTMPLIVAIEMRLLQIKAAQEENRKLCGNCYNTEYLDYVCVDTFGNLIRPNYVTSTFPKLLEKLELPTVRFHDLRHTCAEFMFANSIPIEKVSDWLGHSDIQTTVNIYGHLDYSTKVESAGVMEDVLQLLPLMVGDTPETVSVDGQAKRDY